MATSIIYTKAIVFILFALVLALNIHYSQSSVRPRSSEEGRGGPTLVTGAGGRLLDGDLHLCQAPGQPHPVLVVAAVESNHSLVVPDLTAALAVLHEARPRNGYTSQHYEDIFRRRPFHGRRHSGGDTGAFTLGQLHILLTGPHQLLGLAELLLGDVDPRWELLTGTLQLQLALDCADADEESQEEAL